MEVCNGRSGVYGFLLRPAVVRPGADMKGHAVVLALSATAVLGGCGPTLPPGV